MTYVSPYPYFGGKARVAPQVWRALGNTPNYVEPFFGGGAVLLARPLQHCADGDWPLETINDKDGMVSNFWRALQADPEAVYHYANWPANENDLHARHWWLVNRLPDLTRSLEGNPDFFDCKAAGWWVWGMALWIGSGFCSGDGPWRVVDEKLIRVGSNGIGVQRQRLHVGNNGQGVQRQLLHVGNNGQGLYQYMLNLAARMRRVRVCSGDWLRVMGPTPTFKHGVTGIFLDPPYRQQGRDMVYNHEHADIADDVMRWAIANGDNRLLRLVYAGYADGDMERQFEAAGWRCEAWKTKGGYGGQAKGNSNGKQNAHRERLWYSPHCIQPDVKPVTMDMFTGGAT